MLFMPWKTLVAQYTLPAVAFIAQGVGIRIFFGEIKRYIISLKEILKIGAMGPIRSPVVIVVVTVRAVYQTPYGIRAQ